MDDQPKAIIFFPQVLEELSPFSHLCDENLRPAEQFYYCCRRCFNVLLSITNSPCLKVPVTCL